MLIPTVRLIRIEENFEFGTFGVLAINSEMFCLTLEPPSQENASNISSIPCQQYFCERYSSERYPSTYQVMNVPGRFNILFHSGNTKDDTAGCILCGETIGKLKHDRAILNSGRTFNRLMALMEPYDRFHLTIKEEY